MNCLLDQDEKNRIDTDKILFSVYESKFSNQIVGKKNFSLQDIFELE